MHFVPTTSPRAKHRHTDTQRKRKSKNITSTTDGQEERLKCVVS